jgi:membrane protein DedA with SNARE-associated domain
MVSLHDILGQLAKHGYALLFVWVAAEQLGLPIPAVPVLIAAGVLSATGQLTFAGAFGLGILACMIGDSAWYGIGKWKGTAVLQTLCRMSLEPESCVRQSSNFITRHGGRSLMIAKFIPGIGAVAVPLAANSDISTPSFILYDFLGCIAYVGAYLGVGRLLGDRIDKLDVLAGSLRTATAGFAVVGTAAILAWRYRQRHRFLTDLRMARIKPEEVKGMIDRGEKPYIVDLRHALDFLPDPRVIPGAVRMTPDDVTARQQEIPRDREIILYCT